MKRGPMWLNVGPPLATSAQHHPSNGSTSHVGISSDIRDVETTYYKRIVFAGTNIQAQNVACFLNVVPAWETMFQQ